MTKKQKKKFKRLKRKEKRHFIEALPEQQREVGLNTNWERAYRRRCEKKGVECPLDRRRVSGGPPPAAAHAAASASGGQADANLPAEHC